MLGAAGFVAVCAMLSISFVAARGGLELPIASASSEPVAVASAAPTLPVTAAPSPTVVATTVEPSPTALAPSPSPTRSPVPSPPPDPLAALPGCPDRPGCYLYTVRRGDTLGRIAERFDIPYAIVAALNYDLADPSTIVRGQLLYLGRDPFVRLERCPDRDGCYLYVIVPGDRLSTIADRYAVPMTAILELNPAIDDPGTIYSGQVIRIPRP